MTNASEKFVCLTGELAFKSEVLYLKNLTVLLQLASIEEGEANIILTAPQYLKWQTELQIGHAYRISELKRCSKAFGTERSQEFFLPTVDSTYQELPHVRPDPDFSNYVSVSGRVVEECPDFCIYVLENGERVCLLYLLDHAKMSKPEPGDVISVENGHRCGNHVVACAKTCVTFHKMGKSIDRKNSSNESLQKLVQNLQLGFKDVLWMSKQLPVLGTKFPSGGPVDPRQVLAVFLREAYKSKTRRQCIRFLSYEFLSKEHFCPAFQSVLPMYRLATIEQVCSFVPENSHPGSRLWTFWEFLISYRKPKETYLVGNLRINESSGELRLEDCTGSVRLCVLEDGDSPVKLFTLLDSCVFLSDYVYVAEKFHLSMGNPVTCAVAVKVGNVVPLLKKCSSVWFYRNVFEDLPMQMLEPVKCYDLIPRVTLPLYSRQFCVVLHKSAVAYDFQSKGPEFFLYVCLIGPREDMISDDKQDLDLRKLVFGEKHILRCTEGFLRCYAFIADWIVLEIRTNQGETLKSGNAWTLPQRSKIVLLDYNLGPPPDKVRIHSVSSVLKCQRDQLWNIEGIIIDRRHKRRDEVITTPPTGYGVYENCTIILTLLDTQTLDTINLHLENLESSLYLSCLVLGARVIAKYVTAVKKSPHEFETTKLSTILVSDVKDVTDLKARYLKYARPQLIPSKSSVVPGNLVWIDLKHSALERCELQALCLDCNSLYTKGVCSKENCTKSKGYAVFAEARCIIEEDPSRLVIHVLNDLVRQLVNFSIKEYTELATVVADEGSLGYRMGSTLRHIEGSPQLFQVFCSQLFLEDDCIVAQCRLKNPDDSDDGCYKVFEEDNDNSTHLIALCLIRIPKRELKGEH